MNPEIWFPNLGIQIEHLDRVAFNFFGRLPIYWYGIIIVTSILVASAYVVGETKRTGQDTEKYYDMAFFGIAAAIIGARAYYVIFSWDAYKDNLIKVFAFREGGLALYGSLIGGILALIVYTKVRKLSFLEYTDTIAPGFMLAQATGRWGNFINREAFGGFTENIFAMRYLSSTVPYIPAPVLEKTVMINGAAYIQVHPTFLYESAWNLAGFALLLLLKGKKKYHGQMTALYFIIYGTGRIWIEGLRTDQLQIGASGIAISQVLSGVFISLAVIYLIYNRNRADLALAVAEDTAVINVEAAETSEADEILADMDDANAYETAEATETEENS